MSREKQDQPISVQHQTGLTHRIAVVSHRWMALTHQSHATVITEQEQGSRAMDHGTRVTGYGSRVTNRRESKIYKLDQELCSEAAAASRGRKLDS